MHLCAFIFSFQVLLFSILGGCQTDHNHYDLLSKYLLDKCGWWWSHTIVRWKRKKCSTYTLPYYTQ